MLRFWRMRQLRFLCRIFIQDERIEAPDEGLAGFADHLRSMEVQQV